MTLKITISDDSDGEANNSVFVPEELDTIMDNNEEEEKYEINDDTEPPVIPPKIEKIRSSCIENSKMTPEEFDSKVEETVNNMKQNADTIKNSIKDSVDYEYIEKNMGFFNKFLSFNPALYGLDIERVMSSWTNFNYSPFMELRGNYIKNTNERLVLITELEKLFDTKLLQYTTPNSYRFDMIAFSVCKFIGNTNMRKLDTKFEHELVKSLLSKLVICMNCETDRAFVSNVSNNNSFKACVFEMNKQMKWIENTRTTNGTQLTRAGLSWKVFRTALFDNTMDGQVFKYKSPSDLYTKLVECDRDKEGTSMEILIANCLKTYIPAIQLSYYLAIKNVYLIGRLISIYVINGLYKNKSRRDIEFDLYTIVACMIIDYETFYLANSMVPRSFPRLRNDDQISKQGQLYFINHQLTGPQYYVLKQLELSIPTIVTMLVR